MEYIDDLYYLLHVLALIVLVLCGLQFHRVLCAEAGIREAQRKELEERIGWPDDE